MFFNVNLKKKLQKFQLKKHINIRLKIIYIILTQIKQYPIF